MCCFDCVLTPVTLIFSRDSTSEISRSRPWRSCACTTMSTENTPSFCWPQCGFDHALGLQRGQALQVAAVAPVYRHAAAAGDETGDGVGRRRPAALGQLRQQLVHADDEDAAVVRVRLALARQQGSPAPPRRRRCAAQRRLQLLRADFLAPGRGEQFLALGVAELLRQVVQIGAGHALRAAVRARRWRVPGRRSRPAPGC